MNPIPDFQINTDDFSGVQINLSKYADSDVITKQELSRALGCCDRTIQRMVQRYEIPPPTSLAGRKIWLVGKLRKWITDAVERKEMEALGEAKRLRIIQN